MRARNPSPGAVLPDGERSVPTDDASGDQPVAAMGRLVGSVILGILVVFALIALVIVLV